MNKITENLMVIFLIALIVFFAGCAGQEITTPVTTPVSSPVSTPTGHEQAGEPNMSYLGLAEVFNGMTGVNVSVSSIDVDLEGVSPHSVP